MVKVDRLMLYDEKILVLYLDAYFCRYIILHKKIKKEIYYILKHRVSTPW